MSLESLFAAVIGTNWRDDEAGGTCVMLVL